MKPIYVILLHCKTCFPFQPLQLCTIKAQRNKLIRDAEQWRSDCATMNAENRKCGNEGCN